MIWVARFANAMTSLHGQEIEWIVALQRFAHLEQALRIATYVAHSSIPYLMGLIYLALSPRLGSRLYLLASVNTCLVWILKSALHLPRPYWLDDRVEALDKAGFYGMPSGHVQGATVFWFFLAWYFGRAWGWAVAGLMVGLVALSRIYFGVHFVSDVLGGFLAGAALVAGFRWAEVRLGDRLKQLGLGRQLGAALLGTLVIVVFAVTAAWMAPALEADPAPSFFAVEFRALKPLLASAAVFFSTACALAAAGDWANFRAAGPLWELGLRCLFAFAGVELIRSGFSWIPAPENRALAALLAMGRSAAVPFWILFAAPLILLKAEFLRPSSEAEKQANSDDTR